MNEQEAIGARTDLAGRKDNNKVEDADARARVRRVIRKITHNQAGARAH